MADGYGRQTREEFARSLSPAALAARIIGHQTGARVNWENMSDFRDDPNGNSDGHQTYRVAFWADLAENSYREARLLTEYLHG